MGSNYQFVRTPDPTYITTEEEARRWAKYFGSLPAFGYDTETNGLDPIKTRIKFASFGDLDHRIALPVRLLPYFEDALTNPEIGKRMTNARVDLHWTANHGIIIRGPIHDTLPADWLYDENRRGGHGLKDTAKEHLGLRMLPFKVVFGDVGKTDNEVETLVKIHDILEARDVDEAVAVLVLLGHARGDEKLLDTIRKLYLSEKAGYVLKPQPTLVRIAREYGLAPKTGGKAGFVNDFLSLLYGRDLELSAADRESMKHLLEKQELIEEAHVLLMDKLKSMVEVPGEPLEILELLVGDYSSLDAWASNALVETFYTEMLDGQDMFFDDEGTPYTLKDYYFDVSAPFTRVLWNMERRGLSIDLVAADELDKPMRKEMGRIEREIVKLAGFDMNPNSTQQLRDALFKQLPDGSWVDPFGGEPMHMTGGGTTGVKAPSTSKEVLESYAERGHELSRAIVDYRAVSKLYGTYVHNMQDWVDHRGRVHTSLKQTGTVTGRLSSSDPNLQNIPAKGDMGRKIRKLFIAGRWGDCSPDWCMDHLVDAPVPNLPDDFPMELLVADYAQLEMRIMAHFSGDENMIQAIKDDLDLHCWTGHLASEYIREAGMTKDAFDYDDLKKAKKAVEAGSTDPRDLQLVDVRSAMKAIGFGLLYGIGAVKLGRQLNLPITESVSRKNGRVFQKCALAEKLIDAYFSAYPGVKQFIDETHESAKRNLFVQTYTGRHRRLPDIASYDRGVAAQAERQSVNSIIQGTAADITNEAMLKCESDLKLRSYGCRLLLQIHDELVFEVPKDPELIEKAKIRVRQLMEDPFDMRVPIAISMDTAESWGDAK